MDIYTSVTQKGSKNYIDELEKIKWFDNPYINKSKMINEITNSSSLPYLATHLKQTGFVIDFHGTVQVKHILESLKMVIPELNFSVNKIGVDLEIHSVVENIKIDFEEFEPGEGTDSFIENVINPFLNKAKIKFRFYELPPDDETTNLIFVKPETYQIAIKNGLIPDFMGYYIVNY